MEDHNQNALKNLNDDDGKTAEENADSFRLEGNEHFRANDFKKAVELYSKSLEAKKTVPALLNRSFSYVKMERYEEALADADEALKMDSGNLKGKCRRGIALRELGRYSLALKEFADCLEREPESGSFQQLYDQCQKLARRVGIQQLNAFPTARGARAFLMDKCYLHRDLMMLGDLPEKYFNGIPVCNYRYGHIQ